MDTRRAVGTKREVSAGEPRGQQFANNLCLLDFAVVLIAASLCAVSCESNQTSSKPSESVSSGSEPSANEVDSSADPENSEIRTHYIAAEPVTWNYAPAGRDEAFGEPFSDSDKVFVEQAKGRIGRNYEKVRYVAYESEAFEEKRSVPKRWKHKGLLGPVLKAEVGDVLKVVFKNNAARPYSVHPHGVLYDKASEGAKTNDGTKGAATEDDAVAPGETHTYTWRVPERAGPGPEDPSSVVWLYHSHVHTPKDTNAGLIGPIIVADDGMLGDDGLPKDVDREFIGLFKIYDENQSWYLDENIQKYAGNPESVDPSGAGFGESNLMHTINGYVYGSLPLMEMKQGEKIRWYLVGFGTEPDLHTPHWHGNTATVRGRRTDVVNLLPATMQEADMTALNPGIWLFHCHVDDHITAGMTGRYAVKPADQ